MKKNFLRGTIFIILAFSLVVISFLKEKSLQQNAPVPVPVNAAPAVVSKTVPQGVAAGDHFQQQFVVLTEKALKVIPTVQRVRQLPQEQLHLTPEVILAAGLEIGRVGEFLDQHPELTEQGLDFYEKCATGEDYPTSIRASCYFDFGKLANKNGSRRKSPQVPENVQSLARQLQ